MIGDVIVKQFGGDNGELVKQAYGEFVSKHPEAVASYKVRELKRKILRSGLF
jgi:phosphatidate phosphatase APP1